MAINLVTNVLGFILVLGVLIYAHEFGHFITAKLLRVRVLVFSFGFGKRLFGIKRGDTDYRVSAIPLGGYVKMAGDNPDETSDDASEFLAKPKWQRFLILLAGPAANLFLAVALLTAFFMFANEVWRDSDPVIGGVVPGKPAAAAGIRVGDRILAANDDPIASWDDFRMAISMSPAEPVNLRVERDGREMEIVVTPEKQITDMGTTGIAGVSPFVTTEIGRVLPGSAAEKAGLRAGDRIVEADGVAVTQLTDLGPALEKGKTAPVKLVVDRAGSRLDLVLPMRQEADTNYPGFTPPTTIRKLGLRDAFMESLRQNKRMLNFTFVTIGRLFRAKASVRELSGPLDIARISGEMLRTGLSAVIFLMANISLQLGIMNLLPIPVLDGGHILILLIEGIGRRDLSIRVKERIQQAGLAMLALLMIVVLFNDVVKNVLRVVS